MIQESISHPNSETMKLMGLEMAGFLIYMSQQTDGIQCFDTLGHFTKDDDAITLLISNFFHVMSLKEKEFLPP